MEFRNSRNMVLAERAMQPLEEFQAEDRKTPRTGQDRWSTALLMVGSALLGATAIAFWNRRTIASMRAQIEAQPERSVATPPRGEEIV